MVSKPTEEAFELQPGCFVLRLLSVIPAAFWGFIL